jgi:hypothetical protein
MEQKWQIPQNPSSHLLDPLNELKGHSFDILLQNLFVDLKVTWASFPAEHTEPSTGARAREELRREGRSIQLGRTCSRPVGGMTGLLLWCSVCLGDGIL